MNNYGFHAMSEFKAAGWLNDDGSFKDEMQGMICKHVLELLNVFHGEGHSGSSAPYALNLFDRLAKFKPLVPLTGEDCEWKDVSQQYGKEHYQNKRCGAVFKDKNGAYHVDGKVFWEWESSPEIDGGKPFKSYYTNRNSNVPVTFPYDVPEKPEYVFVPTEKFPYEELHRLL